jgi:hypothetical protein
MIRTLTLVACFTLLAGLAMGFFVAQAKTAADRHAPASRDPTIERKVAVYADYYNLTEDETSRVRETLKEYDRRLKDLLLQVRARHQREFRELAEAADAQIREVIAGKGK